MRLLAKIGLLSYGYLMGILWVSYGKGRERAGKSPQNCIFYGVENRDNTFISVYLCLSRHMPCLSLFYSNYCICQKKVLPLPRKKFNSS